MRNWQCLVVTAKPATRKWQPKKNLKTFVYSLWGNTCALRNRKKRTKLKRKKFQFLEFINFHCEPALKHEEKQNNSKNVASPSGELEKCSKLMNVSLSVELAVHTHP